MTAQPEKYCDLVMKGGITSGIVYPNAVLELAKEYRFKSIGGTSAGAIAAAVTAAAAVGDRRHAAGAELGEGAGFEGMAGIAGQLSSEGFIYRLFQPASGSKNAFRLAVLLASHARLWRKAAGALVAVVAIAPIEFFVIVSAFLGLGYWLGGWGGTKAALLPALFCAYGGAATCAALRVARVARRNHMGLCSGMRGNGGWPWWRQRGPALTEWLHETLQGLAGQRDEAPLTFGDLKNAPRYSNEPASDYSINLQVITTGVSHREPRTLPFANKAFWFLKEEFDRLFPSRVVEWMIAHGGGEPLRVGGNTYHRLPDADRFPVLVAARMSLSFPLLISAVPLHEPCEWRSTRDAMPDQEEDEISENPDGTSERTVAETMEGLTSGGKRRAADVVAMRVCWFSDGGISSNFPIHLFDAGLPVWPTFAINLRYPPSGSAPHRLRREESPQAELEAAVFLPPSNNHGWKVSYHPVASSLAIREVSNFVFGIVGTMQNWRDLLQSRAPGHRDRIVHVSLQGTEGGMNLDMPQHVLRDISEKGAIAGRRFASFSFENHYWVRWRNLGAAVQHYTVEFADSTTPERWIPAYAQACALPLSEDESPAYRFQSAAAADEAKTMYRNLHEQGRLWKAGQDLSKTAPNPRPQLRITPTY